MNRIKQLRLKNIFNYITFFLLVPFACILVALFAYTAHLTTSHEKELLHLAAKDISQSFRSSLGGISDSARQATYSNNFTYFCNSSEAKKVDKYAGAFLDECQSQLFPYSKCWEFFFTAPLATPFTPPSTISIPWPWARKPPQPSGRTLLF